MKRTFSLIFTMVISGLIIFMIPEFAQAAPNHKNVSGILFVRALDGNTILIKKGKTYTKIKLAHVKAFAKTRCMDQNSKEFLNERLHGAKLKIVKTVGGYFVYDKFALSFGYDLPVQAELSGAGISKYTPGKTFLDAQINSLYVEAQEYQLGYFDKDC